MILCANIQSLTVTEEKTKKFGFSIYSDSLKFMFVVEYLKYGIDAQIKFRGEMMSDYINAPKTKRGEATMNRIVDAAAEIFFEKGFHNGSITDITNRASTASGTFYIYFDSKLSVYRYLLTEYGKDVRRRSHAAIAGAKSRKEAERLGIRSFFEYVLETPGLFNIIWESLYIDKEMFYEYYSTFSKSYASRLKTAQLDGEVRDIDPEVLSYVLIGITNFVALNSIVLKGEKDIDYLVDQIMLFLDGGLFTE